MEIANKVAQSGIVIIDPADFYLPGKRMFIDIADQLWQGIALREKDFREFVKTHDWTQYSGAYVSIWCSADAVIPKWAYMLVTSALTGIAAKIYHGNLEMMEIQLYQENVNNLDLAEYENARVVIKGCGDKNIPSSAYVALASRLLPVVKSLMYGEPCSTVPVYKRK